MLGPSNEHGGWLVASLDEVGRQVRNALERLPFRQLREATNDLDAASATVQETVSPTLEVGLGQERGFLHFMSAEEDSWSKGKLAKPETATVAYDYMRHVQEVHASAEISIADIRQGLSEFFNTGARPAGVEWAEG